MLETPLLSAVANRTIEIAHWLPRMCIILMEAISIFKAQGLVISCPAAGLHSIKLMNESSEMLIFYLLLIMMSLYRH